MKTITATDLLSIVKPAVDPGVACHRLGRYYCRPMQARGKCTTKCREDCRKYLVNIFTNMHSKDDQIRDPVALLVWAARSEIASVDEGEEHKGATPVTDWLGQPANADIFELYRRSL